MKKIELYLTSAQDRSAIHDYLKRKLGLPDYYGGNLDALYDCLTGICEDTRIGITEQLWNVSVCHGLDGSTHSNSSGTPGRIPSSAMRSAAATPCPSKIR